MVSIVGSEHWGGKGLKDFKDDLDCFFFQGVYFIKGCSAHVTKGREKTRS